MKKGVKTIIAGGILFSVSSFLVPLVIMLPFLFDSHEEWTFTIPATKEIEITKPGRYYLWNNFRTVHEGKNYTQTRSIPDGVEIKIMCQNGDILTFVSNTAITSTVGQSSKNSIGYVEIETPGTIKIEISNSPTERVFSFSKSSFMRFTAFIIGGLGFSILASFLSVCICGWGVYKLLTQNKKQDDQSDKSSQSHA